MGREMVLAALREAKEAARLARRAADPNGAAEAEAAALRKYAAVALANLSTCRRALSGALGDGALLALGACAEGSSMAMVEQGEAAPLPPPPPPPPGGLRRASGHQQHQQQQQQQQSSSSSSSSSSRAVVAVAAGGSTSGALHAGLGADAREALEALEAMGRVTRRSIAVALSNLCSHPKAEAQLTGVLPVLLALSCRYGRNPLARSP